MIGDLEVYRTREEVEEWITQDPIRRLEQRLRELGVGSAALADIDVEVTRRIEEAAAWAISDPESTLESAYEDVWA
jgi:pyruvate dehydrogenase E1 component alpha subunit